MAEISGIDTIKPEQCHVNGQSIEVSKDIILIGQKVLIAWNSLGMSFIPFCTQCREPLVWHQPADGDTLFHCPVCERKWVMDNYWIVELQTRR